MLEWALAAAMTLSCNDAARVAIVAHRGGMDSGHPENTLPAFEHAAAVGTHAIELDLRATREGSIVVLHDPRVDRTTNGRGRVRDLTAEEIGRLDAGAGTRIPTLDEVLRASARQDVDLLFDLKPAPGLDLEAVVARADESGRLPQIIFGIRSLNDHARLSRMRPDLRLLAFVPRPEHVAAFLEAGVEIVRLWPHWLRLRPELMEQVHAAGASVWVTAGDASVEELWALADLGVDGLLTDRPAAAVAAFGCR